MLEELIIGINIFVLATFLGVELIHRVPPILHTPLMSGANAISGITIVGALISVELGSAGLAKAFGVMAIIFAMINVIGGFAVTNRMLRMFKKRESKK
ncbi:MAG: NAD(P) transhydrogenase subunit alpha [Deltaproteobacteria bacterium]|nr:NAD(P) transhydrogenase subunit alpha [Deltaproteobacteria bacterium]